MKESLGTQRKDIIYLQDYQENRVSSRDMRTVEVSCLSNQPEPQEVLISQENQKNWPPRTVCMC